jgi:hypothetical protein
MNETWKAIIASLFGVLVTAIIGYLNIIEVNKNNLIMMQKQIEASSNKLDKQLKAEFKKIRYQKDKEYQLKQYENEYNIKINKLTNFINETAIFTDIFDKSIYNEKKVNIVNKLVRIENTYANLMPYIHKKNQITLYNKYLRILDLIVKVYYEHLIKKDQNNNYQKKYELLRLELINMLKDDLNLRGDD